MGKYTSQMLEELQEAFTGAFPNEGELKQMVRFRFDEKLGEIVGGNGLNEVVFNLIEWAESKERLSELARRANEYNPGNEHLSQVTKKFIFIDDSIKMQNDARYQDFIGILEDLRRFLSAGLYTPDFYQAFIYLLEQIEAEIRNGTKKHDVVQRIIFGDFVQASWTINDIYQAQKNVFDTILRKLVEETDGNPTSTIAVPIVLVVMTREEALEINDKDYFESYSTEFQDAFEKLRGLLEGENDSDWTESYGTTPEDWSPFHKDGHNETIKDLIEKGLNAADAGSNSHFFVLFNIRELNDEESRTLLKELRQKGCIIVIDDLSLCHKTVYKALHQSGLDVSPDTTMVRIAPVRSALEVLEELELLLQMKISEMEFFKRQKYDPGDFGSCAEVSNKHQLKDWLVTRTRKMYQPEDPESPTVRKFMFNGLRSAS